MCSVYYSPHTAETKITAVSKRDENSCPCGVHSQVKAGEQYANKETESNKCCGENNAGEGDRWYWVGVELQF